MYAFSYQRPADLAETIRVIGAEPDARALAGGMTLIPSMKHRLTAPTVLLDIGRLPELQGITIDGDSITIGAATRHGDVVRHSVLGERLPALAHLAQSIGDRQVRARGTIGGSLANNDPAADYPAAVLGLDATIITDRRDIAADSFFQGMFTTALAADELVVRIRFPLPRRAAYAKFHHPASGYAMTGVFVARTAGGVRVAVTGAGSSVFRWTQAEAALTRSFAASSLDGLTLSDEGLNADMHAPAAYRAHLVVVMTRRAVEQIEAST